MRQGNLDFCRLDAGGDQKVFKVVTAASGKLTPFRLTAFRECHAWLYQDVVHAKRNHVT